MLIKFSPKVNVKLRTQIYTVFKFCFHLFLQLLHVCSLNFMPFKLKWQQAILGLVEILNITYLTGTLGLGLGSKDWWAGTSKLCIFRVA